MRRTIALLVSFATGVALVPGMASAARPTFTPGAAGVGDPYYPLDGNGGYDVQEYELDLRYDPETDVLEGTATIEAKASQNLSTFNLDFVGMNVRSISVGGRRATWSRSGQELTVTPKHGIRKARRFTVVVRYDGIPEPTFEALGPSGFIATDDGAIIAGQPHGAATWFPANDHPSDKAAFTFHVTAPRSLQVVANGKLDGRRTRRGWTTWTWEAEEPMATYLATVNVGQFDINRYRSKRVRFWDAIAPDLYEPVATPTAGSQFALSGQANSSYKRLLRTFSVPAGGATVGFTVTRATEHDWDFMFVEVHTVGQDDWTTLEDQNGHSSQDTGFSCPFGGWQAIHPFLAQYQTDNGDGTCSSDGTSGTWWAASGASDGAEEWLVNIPATAAREVEVAISYASDEVVQGNGVFVDDIVTSTGEGNTSFEADDTPFDGWTVPGPPADSPGNENDWFIGTVSDVPPPRGEIAQSSFARQPEILSFLSKLFGKYPFKTAGGIVVDVEGLGFALETQTRPIYSPDFFSSSLSGDSVVVHEIAHQWYGDSVALERWQHIWLNEGFATYSEWLWSENENLGTTQENFDFFYAAIPEDDPFWAVPIGDPGAGNEFEGAVYVRGAMTLQVLRQTVGDHAFFRILRRWAAVKADGNVTTDEFIALAERISGQELSDLFHTWLFTTNKPVIASAASRTASVTAVARHAPPSARSQVFRYDLVP